MYKKGAGNDKQGKDAGNRTLCPYRNFSQAIKSNYYSVRKIKLIASRGTGEGKIPRKGSYRCAGTCITCRFFRGQFLPGH